MKKLLTIFALVLALCLTCTAAFADTDSEDGGIPYEDATRIHEIDGHDVTLEKIVKEPGCTTRGIARYACESEDDHFHEVYIQALGHTWDKGKVTVEPTCTDEGQMTYTCVVCGETYTESIEANGHVWSSEVDGVNWGRVTQEPTCTSEGYAEDYCTVCGVVNEEILPRVIAPVDHDFEFIVDEYATCLGNGYGHYECVNCGYWMEEENEDGEMEIVFEDVEEFEGDSDGHDWDRWVVVKPATCAEEGSQIRWCKRCGDKQEQVIDQLEADYVEVDVTTRLIDCYSMEYTYTYSCANCGGKDFGGKIGVVHEDITETEVVEVSSHVFWFEDEYLMTDAEYTSKMGIESEDPSSELEELQDENSIEIFTKAPTCEEKGYKVYKCKFYDETEPHEEDDDAIVVIEYESLGHDWNPWELRVAPWEQENEYGYWIRDCARCGRTEERISRFADNPCEDDAHVWVEEEYVEPTCTQEGYINYFCNICGAPYTETLEKLPHQYEAVETVEPTCTEEGYTNYQCKVCGDAYTETVEALGHTVVIDEAVAPTTETEGKTEGSHCSVCGIVLQEQETIEKLAPAHYSVEKDGSNVSLKADEGAATIEEPIVYVVWSYTLADGSNFSYTRTIEANANGNYRIGSPKAPAGATLDSVLVVVVDDIELENSDVATANAKNLGLQVF
ncbi:MAG: hypothetical protein IJ074_05055 [Clostridia bacterium]|nr:hypothetical protein [Clostridia bacterium]